MNIELSKLDRNPISTSHPPNHGYPKISNDQNKGKLVKYALLLPGVNNVNNIIYIYGPWCTSCYVPHVPKTYVIHIHFCFQMKC